MTLAPTLLFRVLAALLVFTAGSLTLTAQPNQPIRVLAPTTGQNLVVDTTYNVIWTTTNAVTGTLIIEYSTDSAATWTLVDTTAPTGGADTLRWTAPNSVTTNAYIRVRETGTQRSGRSGRFNIVSSPVPLLQVLYPNGGFGQTFAYDSVINIRWYAEYVTGSVKVQYTVDSGMTWTSLDTITARAGNDTLSWTIPHSATSRAMVRVATLNDSTSDRSNNYFSIQAPDTAPSITVQSPNGGNTLIFDSTARIRWTTANVTGQLKVQYSVDSGATWTGIDTVAARAGNDTLFWTVPRTATTRALVRVATLNDATSDRSNGVFTIQAPDTSATITLQSPNGNNVFLWDSTARIRWNTANVTGQLKVQYSVDSGATWRGIDTVAARAGNDTLFWVIPHDSTFRAFVRVATLNDSISDRSNRAFAILPPDSTPSVRVLSPNGANLFGWDSAVSVRWTSEFVTGQFKVEYSIDSGATWTGIDTVAARSGNDTLVWITPHVTTTRALIRISTLDDAVTDRSNNVFTIKESVNPSVRVIAPNGGETYRIGQTALLAWEASDVTVVQVQISRDSGATWVPIATRAAVGYDTLSWTATGPATTTALIRVASTAARDTSDAVFTIAEPLPAVIHLLSPNGGEVLRADSVVTIYWVDSNVTGPMLIAYSVNNGANWNIFDTVAPVNGLNSLQWTVPNDSTSRALITIAGPNGEPFDQSDAPFVILPRPASVDRPVSGVAGAVVHPNPATDLCILTWEQVRAGAVSVQLHDMRGTLVATFDLGVHGTGRQTGTLDLRTQPAGSYRYSVISGGTGATGTVVVVR